MHLGAITSSDWVVSIPLVVAFVAAGLALGRELVVKRRDEKRELRALVRVVDQKLADLEGALNALIGAAAREASPSALRASARFAQQTRSRTVWEEQKLPLARLLEFDEWDRLREVYAVIGAAWYEIDSESDSQANALVDDLLVDDVLVALNTDDMAPRLLKVIPRAREICARHRGGALPPKVSLLSLRDPAS